MCDKGKRVFQPEKNTNYQRQIPGKHDDGYLQHSDRPNVHKPPTQTSSQLVTRDSPNTHEESGK